MNKFFYFFGVILLIFLLFIRFNENPYDHMGKVVAIAAEGILEEDGGMSEHYRYIAIDLTNIYGLSAEDGKDIINFFKEKYKLDCLLASLDELKELGLYEHGLPDGVLVRFDSFSTTLFKNVTFIGSKFVSPKGGIGVKGKIHYKNENWQVKRSRVLWES